uniref:Uncharacterized protein n=1 Tax=Brassica oleracea var. oleracea TaxID=109376 RepID=A0A0D3E3B8_BRAOL
MAHDIFYSDHNTKFNLEHAWCVLRYEQKWLSLNTPKPSGSSKRKAGETCSQTSSTTVGDHEIRPEGIKAAKAKRNNAQGKSLDTSIWEMKKEDLMMKKKLSKLAILATLLAKKEPLSEAEEVVNNKLLAQRRFQMNKSLFLRIVHRLSTEVPYFQPTEDATGRSSLSPLQKCTAAIRQLAYGGGADTVDEYVRLAETTARKWIIGSIDCMHWEWKNCPTAWKGMYSRGTGKPTIVLEVVASYDLWIWHAFFGAPGEKNSLFAKTQEAVRKDVERAFGVLRARFAVVKNPSKLWDKDKIANIMRACIILHNMIVEDERSSFTQYDVFEFQQGEDVDDTFSVDMPTNLGNTIDRRATVRNRQAHQQLKMI